VTTGEVLGSANSNPFRTIQRQDVGIQLTVKPQVNAGGGITLSIRQEVSSVSGPVSTTSSELVLNKRELETTVLVDDGAVVVLGGLLDENERISLERVPYLSDVPVVGELFKSRARSGGRTNLMIFIRPRIIRDAADAQAASGPRYDYLRKEAGLVGQDGGNALDAVMRDYLRTLPPGGPASAPPTDAGQTAAPAAPAGATR